MKLLQLIKTVIRDIKQGKNIELYLALPVTFIVAIIGLFPNYSYLVPSVTLTVLGILAGSVLKNRRQNEQTYSLLRQIKNNNKEYEQFINGDVAERANLQQPLLASHSAFFWGMYFQRTIPNIKEDLEKALRQGAEIRILVMKPESLAVDMYSRQSIERKSEVINHALKTNFASLASITKRFPNVNLSVKYIDQLPPASFFVFDPYSSKGVLFARMIPFQIPESEALAFRINRQHDNQRFDTIVKQFEAAWAMAENVDLAQL